MRWRCNQLNIAGALPRGKSALTLNTEKAGWLGPTASMKGTEKRKISFPVLEIEARFLDCTARTAVTIPIELHRLCCGVLQCIPTVPLLDWRVTISLLDSCILAVLLLDWRVTISLLDSCIPAVPLLGWRVTVSLQTHVFLLSLYWTEVAQYLYRLMYSCCPSIGLKWHSISTDSCIPVVLLLDWRVTISPLDSCIPAVPIQDCCSHDVLPN
jgi:hypothetical protein